MFPFPGHIPFYSLILIKSSHHKEANDMQALVYYRSIPRYLLAQGLNRLWPRHFFQRVAPLKLQQLDPAATAPAGSFCATAFAASAALT